MNVALEEFDTLTLNSVFNVELIQGTTNSISIEGAEKIIEKVDFNIENNTLTLLNNFKGYWIYPKKNKITVKLTVNDAFPFTTLLIVGIESGAAFLIDTVFELSLSVPLPTELCAYN